MWKCVVLEMTPGRVTGAKRPPEAETPGSEISNAKRNREAGMGRASKRAALEPWNLGIASSQDFQRGSKVVSRATSHLVTYSKKKEVQR
jgi:hypothetical protein